MKLGSTKFAVCKPEEKGTKQENNMLMLAEKKATRCMGMTKKTKQQNKLAEIQAPNL